MPLLCIHKKDGSNIEAQYVRNAELLAIVAALQLAVNINSNLKIKEIATDSLGRCQIANKRKTINNSQHPHSLLEPTVKLAQKL